MMIRMILSLLLLALGASAFADTEYLNSGATLPKNLPFSEAVRNGDTIYLSGQIPNEPGTLNIVKGGFTAQAHQVMKNIASVLSAHGYSMDDLVKCTVMLQDMDDWPAFNKVYAGYFDKHFPARSAFGTNGLAAGALLEVECIAAAKYQ